MVLLSFNPVYTIVATETECDVMVDFPIMFLRSTVESPHFEKSLFRSYQFSSVYIEKLVSSRETVRFFVLCLGKRLFVASGRA